MNWNWISQEKAREKKSKKPKYYSVTVKAAPEWISNIGFIPINPGTPLGFYAIRANIIERDTGKVVDKASGYFDSMEKVEEGLKKLQDEIQEKIKALYAKDTFIQRLYQIDIINNGLEMFLS